jgi:uncharacterized protein (TIGR03437 family)
LNWARFGAGLALLGWLSTPIRGQYTISLVAGNGRGAYSGDNGPATSAGMSPVAVAVDSTGNLYIADANHRIRKVDITRTITTIAGGGTKYENDGVVATDAAIGGPAAVAVDSFGNVYYCYGIFQIFQVDTSGFLHIFADTGFAADGLTFDGAGNLYVSASVNHQVVKVSPNGVVTIVAGTGSAGYSGDNGPALSAQLRYPHGLAVDTAGNLFIADSGNNRIRKVDASGIITIVAGNGMALDNDTGDGRPAINATLNNPEGVAVDSAGNLYIPDDTDVIRKVDASGIITTIAGISQMVGESGDGGPATKAQLSGPRSPFAAPSGAIYFIDSLNYRVRVLTPVQTTPPPAATITSLLPSSAPAGGPGFVLTVNGTGFLSGAAVRWSGSALATTFVSATQLTAQVPASLIAAAGTASITVLNPGAAASNALMFNVGSTSSCTPTGLLLQTINPLSAFAVQAGQPLNIGAELVNNCGAVTSAAVTATFSNGDAAIQLTNIGQGNFAGTWSPHAAGGVVIQISAIESLGPGQLLSAGTAISGTVFSAQPQRLVTSVSALSFSVAQGGSPASQPITIQNQGSGTASFTVTVSGGAWLKVDSTAGSATTSAPATVTVTADPTGLAPGTYSGAVIIMQSGGQSLPPVSVSLTVSGSQPILLLSQTALSFTAAEGGGTPLPQDFGILNIGQGAMNWAAAASSPSGWLSLSSTSGMVARPYLDVSSVNANVNPASLTAGTYYGQIQVTVPGFGNLLQTISVVLTVLPRGSSPGPEVRPSGLIFAGPQNAGPGPQTVMISNPGAKSTLFNSAAITLPGVGTWFSNTPSSATIVPGQPAQVSIQASFSNLAPGATRGAITLLFDDGTPRSIALLAVIPPSRSGGALRSEASGCTPAQLNILPSGSQQVLAASVGQPVALDVRVVDSCGKPVTSAAVTATFTNGDSPRPLVHVGNGRWTATWQPQKPVPAGTPAAVQITAFLGLGVSILSYQLDIPVTFGAPSSVPIVSSGGVLNAASFAGSTPVAPGSLIAIFGANLATGNPGQSAVAPLPIRLGATQVLLAGRALPLLFASDGQINAQAPFDLPVNVPSQLVVQTGNALSVPEPILLAPAQPAVFTQDESGQGQGVIVNGVTNALADSNAPVTGGDTLVIYCTGLGAVNPPVALGAAATGPMPTVQPVTVTIGGKPAAVSYAGLTPGFPGLYQVNAVVPAGIAPSGQVPVVLSTAGQSSPPVTMAVQ